jgi:hypothetical protein
MREREIALAEGRVAPPVVSARPLLPRRRRTATEKLDVGTEDVEPEDAEPEDVEAGGLEDEEVLVSGQDPMEGSVASENEPDDEREEDE